MEKKHPKRRKANDNPYHIMRADGQYNLSFRDGQGIVHTFEISEELYLAFNSFELEDLSYLNEWDRHIEHSDVWEETLVKRALEKPYNLEETILKKLQMEQLHKAIGKLSEVQRRRLILYYFYDLTYEQIAEREHCSMRAVGKSVEAARKKIKKIFKVGYKNRL